MGWSKNICRIGIQLLFLNGFEEIKSLHLLADFLHLRQLVKSTHIYHCKKQVCCTQGLKTKNIYYVETLALYEQNKLNSLMHQQPRKRKKLMVVTSAGQKQQAGLLTVGQITSFLTTLQVAESQERRSKSY